LSGRIPRAVFRVPHLLGMLSPRVERWLPNASITGVLTSQA
jgi:hypothetical protein